MELFKFYDNNYITYLKELEDNTFYNEEYKLSYSEFDEKLEEADLYGKTVMVTKNQFSNIYNIIEELCCFLEMEYVNAFVYEDFYYGVEAKGVNNKHLEISAKTITDFTLNEIRFLIARELFAIKTNGLQKKVIIEEGLKSLDIIKVPVATELLNETFKISAYKYIRSLNYSCDNFAYTIVGDISVAFKAIIKTILNNKFLAEQIDFSEYLKQGDKISSLADGVNIYTKVDEKVPYGPYRMKNLLAYAASKRGIEARKQVLK